MLKTFFIFLAGIVTGVFTGITPGIHVNLASSLLLGLSATFLQYCAPLDLAIFIVSMATVHTFLDVIPSIFLGAPSEAYAATPLPGHRLLLSGVGYEAVRIATAGGILSSAVAVIITPLLWPIVPWLDRSLAPYTATLLIVITLILILREPGLKKSFIAFGLTILAGLLGYLTLNLMSLGEPLLPLLSGLFGASSILLSMGESSALPPQFITEMISISKRKQALLVACAVMSGWIVSLLPGVGPVQAAILSTALLPTLLPQEYLFLVGGIGAVNFILSIISMVTVEKARNGAIAVAMQILPNPTITDAAILLFACLAAAGLGAFIALKTARVAVKILSIIPYRVSCLAVLAIVTIMVLWRSGIPGLLIFITSTSLGILASTLGAPRVHLMACLTAPVIVYLW